VAQLVGKPLGQNYRIVEPIGAGAMGMVYVVEHVTLKKRFAAKLLTAELARRPEAAARFEIEAHAASRLDHENIVSVIDFGKTDDGGVFLIMELLRGKTLQARMDQGRLSLEEIVAITLQVCRALAAAHAAGIVHRDMKPDNIFLTQRPGGRPMVKVLDFGISKAREGTLREGRITKQGQLLGSPEYMSPEASRGDEVDPRADIYAVGIMLYELMCGEVPFRHENYLKVLQMHAGHLPRPPRTLVPELPDALERLILRALEKDPRRRHASIEQLEAELLAAIPEVAQRAMLMTQTPPHSQWLPEQSPPMRYSGVYPAMGEPGAPPLAPEHAVSATLDTRRRGRGTLVVLWTGALALAAAAAILLFMRSTEGRGQTDAGDAPPVGAPRAAGAAPSADSPAPAAAPQAAAHPVDEIRLRIDTSPQGATATLEGRRLGRTPIDVQVPASDEEGEIELELRGYRTLSRQVSLARDGEIQVELRRESRRSSRSRSDRRSGRSREDDDSGRAEPERPPVDLDIKEGR
jgi:serine/threonine-protein kinase